MNRTEQKRFWSKVLKTPTCWIWLGAQHNQGYGVFSINHINKKAHRLMYELINGSIDDNLTLDHLCRNRLCVNPQHLEQVTLGENVLRGISFSAINKRKTHCAKGHDLTNPENYTIEKKPDGVRRRCNVCVKEWTEKSVARHRDYTQIYNYTTRKETQVIKRLIQDDKGSIPSTDKKEVST